MTPRAKPNPNTTKKARKRHLLLDTGYTSHQEDGSACPFPQKQHRHNCPWECLERLDLRSDVRLNHPARLPALGASRALYYQRVMIQLKKLNKSYKMGDHSLHVLKDIELTIKSGEFVSIMGSSGSGKSTLLNVLGILDDYDSGEYLLDNKLVKALNERQAAQYRNRFLGFVFQSFNLLPFKTALENVALPLYYQGVPRKKRMQLARDFLERVGLTDRVNHLPSELSGGQQQRVAIARALVGTPKLILADEPTGALDTETSYQLMDLLREVNQQGITIVLVTHETDIANRTDRLIRLKDGRVDN